jgi:hypothetical protein
VLDALKEEGCNALDRFDESDYGKFGWVINLEGNKVELLGAACGRREPSSGDGAMTPPAKDCHRCDPRCRAPEFGLDNARRSHGRRR